MPELYNLIWPDADSLDSVWSKLPTHSARLNVVKELFRQQLVLQSCEQFKVQPLSDPEEIRVRFEAFREALKLADDKRLDMYLKKSHQSKTQLMDRIIALDLLNRLKKIIINDKQVRDAFLKQKRVEDRVLFNLIRVKGLAVAQEIYYQLTHDKIAFSTLADRHALGHERNSHGLIGPVQLNKLNPVICQRLRQMKPDEIAEPLDVGNGMWSVMQLVKWDTSELTTKLEKALRDELFDLWVDHQFLLYLTSPNESRFEPTLATADMLDTPADVTNVSELVALDV